MINRVDKSPEWKTTSDFFNLGEIIAYEEIVVLNFYNQASRRQYTFQCSRIVWDNILNDIKFRDMQETIVNDENRLNDVEFPDRGS